MSWLGRAATACIVLYGLWAAALSPGFGKALPAQSAESAASKDVPLDELERRASEYESLLRDHPDSAELWSNLGAVRAMMGDCPASLKALDRARRLSPKLFVPWYFSGYCHLALHQDESALRFLEQATRINPRDSNAWLLKAQAASNTDQPAASLAAAVRSLELDPQRPEGYYLAGRDALGLATLAYSQIKAEGPAGAYFYRLDGERSASQGARELAIESYRKASVAAPNDPDIAFGLGSAYLESEKYPEAEEALRRCVRLAPDSVWARLRLALALALESKRDEAARIWKQVVPEHLSLPSEWTDYIAIAYLLGDRERARQALRQAKDRLPDQPTWDRWSQRLESDGGAGSGARQFPPQGQEGLTEVGLAVRFMMAGGESRNPVRDLFPSTASYLAFRNAFLKGDAVQAVEKLEPALSAPRSDAPGCFALGEVLQSLSLDFLQHLGTAFPDSEPAMLLAAENYRGNHEPAKALEIYQAVLQKDGRSPAVLRDVAETYWESHEWDHALEVLKELAAADGSDPRVFVNMGRIYLTEQKTGDAERAFRRAIGIRPEMAEAHFGLGEALLRRGEHNGALEELKNAARLDPSDPGTRYSLAQLYQKLGRADLAEQEMSSFQRLRARAGAGKSNPHLVPLD